jgi:acyl-coenzyme A synthetase/AMP-(fatty) acid ligase
MGSLWGLTKAAGLPAARVLAGAGQHVALRQMDGATTLGMALSSCRGRNVMIRAKGQLETALALLELDGVARRIVLCPPDLAPEHLPALLEEAQVEIILTDAAGPVAAEPVPGHIRRGECGLPPLPGSQPAREQNTEWLLFTSGTTGRPKMVVHDLASLVGPADDAAPTPGMAWSTFYDIRRYGGLQILLRALRGGGSMVLSDGAESVGEFLGRASRAKVTHISGTPTHWRRVLMSPERRLFTPDYIRVSGEVADQAILDQLRAAFPAARIVHAFASTEAGVAFDVDDGLAGFPAELIDGAARRVRNGSLLIRSARTASRYTGEQALREEDGFVDTGDMVELRGDRYYFTGRREGLINVGGQKVHPEEVEAAINQHPAVRMSLVRGRASPITGAVVVADVVLASGQRSAFGLIKDEIIARCRAILPAHKVPVHLREVPALDISASGKLRRQHA